MPSRELAARSRPPPLWRAPGRSVVPPFVRSSPRPRRVAGLRRNPRALRPLWYSIPILVIVLTVAAYLIGLSLWARSSLSHWKAQEYGDRLTGYEGQMTWTKIGIERWVAHYNRGTTLARQGLHGGPTRT